MRVVGFGFALLYVATCVGAAEPTQSLTVTSDFEGGSAVVNAVDSERGIIDISPSLRPGRGWPCWWYCRIDGIRIGRPLTLQVRGQDQPFRGTEVLKASWSQPCQAFVSNDDKSWQKSEPMQLESGVATYRFEGSANRMWVAWGPPFLKSHADALLEETQRRLPDSEIFELARSLGNRPVRGLRIGGKKGATSTQYGVWIQARQHAWEAGSSWVGRGFIEWAASDATTAVELRNLATIYYIPIMDVDSVSIGAGGKEQVPHDHNRDWSDHPRYPEVAAAQRKILELNKVGRFDVYIDLHNPGMKDLRPFFFGPRLTELPPIQQRNYARWIAFASEKIAGPLRLEPNFKFPDYVKTQAELNSMSSNWVRQHTARHVLATTLETSWNTPLSTSEGYLTVGRQMGEALANYLSKGPRDE